MFVTLLACTDGMRLVCHRDDLRQGLTAAAVFDPDMIAREETGCFESVHDRYGNSEKHTFLSWVTMKRDLHIGYMINVVISNDGSKGAMPALGERRLNNLIMNDLRELIGVIHDASP
jgi:hypothetical protein